MHQLCSPLPATHVRVWRGKVQESHTPSSESRSPYSPAGGLYLHLDLDTVHDAILEVEGQTEEGKPLGSASGLVDPSSTAVSLLDHGAAPYFNMRDQPDDAARIMRLRFRDKNGVLAGQDIIKLLQYILNTRFKVTNSIVQDEWEIDGAHLLWASQQASPPGLSLSRFEDEVRHLPMAPTQMNKELVRTRSLDESPRPNNRFMKHWITYSIRDPLVLHVVLCSTASFLNETGRVPKTLLLIHRQTVMRMLNEHLFDPTMCTNDSAMLAVAQMILTSWY